MTLGRVVTGTISGGIAKGDVFKNDPDIFMYGMLCALSCATIWLYIATYYEMAVSTTHSISASARPAHTCAQPALRCVPHLHAARARHATAHGWDQRICHAPLRSGAALVAPQGVMVPTPALPHCPPSPLCSWRHRRLRARVQGR